MRSFLLFLSLAVVSASLTFGCGDSEPQMPAATATPATPTSAARVREPIVIDDLGRETAAVQLHEPVNYSPVHAAGSIWVPLMNAGRVLRVDRATGEITAAIEVGPRASAYCCDINALAAGDSSLFVTHGRDRSLVEIDPASNAVMRAFDLELDAYDVLLDGDSIWVTSFADDAVVRLDRETGIIAAVIKDVFSPTGVAAAGGAIWVVEHRAGELVRIDPVSNEVVARIELLGMGRPTTSENVVSAFGSIWVANAASTVSRIDPDTNAQTLIEFPGEQPLRVTAGASGVWVTHLELGSDRDESNHIARIDPDTNQVTRWPVRNVWMVYEHDDVLWLVAGDQAGRLGDWLVRVPLDSP